MDYACELIEQPAQPALSIRTWAAVDELPNVLGRSFAAIAGYLAEKGRQPAGAPFVAYYNMDLQNLDLEIGFPTGEELEGQGAIRPARIPGGKLAGCLHTGPYDQIANAYEALRTWVKTGGFKPTGVAYEIYLTDPQATPPQELQTRLLFPLK